MYPNVHCNIIYNNEEMEITLLSLNRPMNKEEVAHMCTHTHTHNSGILLSHRKYNFAIWNNMDEPGGYYVCEISQRKTNMVCFHLHVEFEK